MPRFAPAPLALAALAAAPAAQTIDRVAPELSSPGSIVALEGTDLGATTHVRFTGFVGGFLGVWTVDVAVQSASATEVEAVVPEINAWIPPWLGQLAGSPFGEVRALSATSAVPPSPPASFYFLEGTGGLMQNVGLGSTHFGGERAAASFDPGTSTGPADTEPWLSVGTGAPFPGNASFVARLRRSTPAAPAPAFLMVARPGPGLPFDDGLLAIDPTQVFGILVATGVDANGDPEVAVPIPPSAQGLGPVVMQWAFVEGFVPVVRISNGLRVDWI